jgi:hypothetical protein
MTHSNHRRGSRESLMSDWIVFAAPGTELVEAVEKHKTFLDILTRHDPVSCTTNTGIEGASKRLRYIKGWSKEKDSGVHESASIDDIRNAVKPRGGSAIFNNKEAVQEVVNELTKAELGFSVVISGIFNEVYDICERAAIRAHTVNMSGETLGKMSLLPEPKILEVTSMCGHHFVAASLARYLIDRVKQGRITAKNAAIEMAKQCTCNFFNADRASKLIEAITT